MEGPSDVTPSSRPGMHCWSCSASRAMRFSFGAWLPSESEQHRSVPGLRLWCSGTAPLWHFGVPVSQRVEAPPA